MGTIKMGLNPVTLGSCNFEDSIIIASKAGFNGMGLRFNLLKDYIKAGHSIEDAKRLIEKHKLITTEMGFLGSWMFRNGIPLAGKRARSGETDEQLIEEMEYLFLVTKELGSPPITALVELNETGSLQKAIEDFGWLCDRAAKHDLRIMLEFSGSAPQINRIKDAWNLIQTSKRPNCGLLLDSFLMFMKDLFLEDLELVLPEKIFTVHISDAKPKPKNELNMLKDRLIPGEGVIPLKDLVRAVQKKGYDGFYTVEIFNEEYNRQDPLTIAKRSLEGLKKLLSE